MAFSPDGKSLAFLSDVEKERQLQIYVAPVSGGPARQITKIFGQVSALKWSADGKAIAFLFVARSEQEPGALVAYKPDSGVVEEKIEEQRIAVADIASGRVSEISPCRGGLNGSAESNCVSSRTIRPPSVRERRPREPLAGDFGKLLADRCHRLLRPLAGGRVAHLCGRALPGALPGLPGPGGDRLAGALATGRRRVAVLGDMLELGPIGPALHRERGAALPGRIDVVVAVGTLAKELLEGARTGGLPAASLCHFPDSAAAAAAMGSIVEPGDAVLVKGSRGVRLEVVVDALLARFGVREG